MKTIIYYDKKQLTPDVVVKLQSSIPWLAKHNKKFTEYLFETTIDATGGSNPKNRIPVYRIYEKPSLPMPSYVKKKFLQLLAAYTLN